MGATRVEASISKDETDVENSAKVKIGTAESESSTRVCGVDLSAIRFRHIIHVFNTMHENA
jgi:hypothetical protein